MIMHICAYRGSTVQSPSESDSGHLPDSRLSLLWKILEKIWGLKNNFKAKKLTKFVPTLFPTWTYEYAILCDILHTSFNYIFGAHLFGKPITYLIDRHDRWHRHEILWKNVGTFKSCINTRKKNLIWYIFTILSGVTLADITLTDLSI